MILICLDIDGVMFSQRQQKQMDALEQKITYAQGFAHEALDSLHALINLIEKAGHEAGILLISDRATGESVYKLKKRFSPHLFAEHIVGKIDDYTAKQKDVNGHKRGERLQGWFQKHVDWNVEKRFVIFDDNPCDLKPLFSGNFVQCNNEFLRKHNYDQARAVLRLDQEEEKISTQLKVVNSGAIKLARNGELLLLKRLLKSRRDLLEQKNACGETPLVQAAIHRKTAVVRYLVQQGANLAAATDAPDAPLDAHGWTALHWAAAQNDSETLAVLLEAKADVTHPVGDMLFNALHLAAQRGHVEVLNTLLTARPELLNVEDKCGQTPLIWAAAKGHKNATAFLLAKGADVHAAVRAPAHDKHGYQAFHFAFENDNTAIMKMLAEAGANLTPRDQQNFPVHNAAKQNRVELLQSYARRNLSSINDTNAENDTPIKSAVKAGAVKAMEFLLEHDKVTRVESLLLLAINTPKNSREMIQLLRRKHVSPTPACKDAFTTRDANAIAQLYNIFGMHDEIFHEIYSAMEEKPVWPFLKTVLHPLDPGQATQHIIRHAKKLLENDKIPEFYELMRIGCELKHHQPTAREKRDYAKDILGQIIPQMDDPLKLIGIIDHIFTQERKQPVLIYSEPRSGKFRFTGHRWCNISVSQTWIQLTTLAAEKILALVEKQPKWLNYANIKNFLTLASTRWPDFFSRQSHLRQYVRLSRRESLTSVVKSHH